MLEQEQREQAHHKQQEEEQVDEVAGVLGEEAGGVLEHDALEAQFVAVEAQVDDEYHCDEHCQYGQEDAQPVLSVEEGVADDEGEHGHHQASDDGPDVGDVGRVDGSQVGDSQPYQPQGYPDGDGEPEGELEAGVVGGGELLVLEGEVEVGLVGGGWVGLKLHGLKLKMAIMKRVSASTAPMTVQITSVDLRSCSGTGTCSGSVIMRLNIPQLTIISIAPINILSAPNIPSYQSTI